MLSKYIVSLFAVAMISTGAVAQEQSAPAEPAPASVPAEENILHLDLSTGGRVTIQLFPKMAPNHVERIKTLTQLRCYSLVVLPVSGLNAPVKIVEYGLGQYGGQPIFVLDIKAFERQRHAGCRVDEITV